MWGKYYLEYLVVDMMPSLDEKDFRDVMAGLVDGKNPANKAAGN